MTSLALLGGMAVTAGVVLVTSGLLRRPVRPHRRAWWRGGAADLRAWSPERAAVVGLTVAGVLFVTRWPVAALGAGLAVALAASAAGKRKRQQDSGAKAEALASWAEMLRDATGTALGIEGVLVATAPNAPELIRPAVGALARRLAYETLDLALQDLVKDLDHPLGDLVVTSLRLSAGTGGRQVRSVLDDLVVVAREEARMHRRVSVARARPRSEMRLVLVIMAVFVGVFTLLARSYLEPYGTVLGQLVLAMVGGCWALAIWSMARLGRDQKVERFLATEAQMRDEAAEGVEVGP